MQNRENPSVTPEALQKRLRAVSDRHSLSEISRRTGAPLASVSRYFRGTRVPADFCGALALHFGVNPVWLLTGEGMPWFSDIPENTSAMAGDLLELVEAMNAVAHMRLGALTGKHHLRVLRELNEALKRFEELRGRLNDHARPVLTRLLEDMEKALLRTDVDRAGELFTAIGQVRRFCDDHELDYRIGRVSAAVELMRRNPSEALKHQQKLFRLILAEGRLETRDELEETIRLAILLAESGRERDALKFCNAAMVLAGEEGKRQENYPFLAFLAGQFMSYNLRLYEGIEMMQRWLPRVTGAARAKAGRHVLALALLYAGLVDPVEAFDVGGGSEVKALNLLYYGLFIEDADYLRRGLRYLDRQRGDRPDLQALGYVAEYARILIDALKKPAADQLKRFGKLAKACKSDDRATIEQEMLVFEAQLLRKLKRKPAARKAMRAADKLLTSPRRAARALLLSRAIHYRNALELDSGELKKAAGKFFEDHAEAGYRALAPDATVSS